MGKNRLLLVATLIGGLAWALGVYDPDGARARSIQPVELPPIVCDQEGELRSGSGSETEIELINSSEQPLEVYWLDFDGLRQFWFDLAPGESALQGTFAAQAWLVADGQQKCVDIYIAQQTSGRAEITAELVQSAASREESSVFAPGTTIAFNCSRDICVVGSDGGAVTNLTMANGTIDFSPQWAPVAPQSSRALATEEETASACTMTVGPGSSIQAAIDEAPAGALICLAGGKFAEHLRIRKGLTLQGEGPEGVILMGIERQEPVILVCVP